MRKLDRKASYATVVGNPGVAFWQDGVDYDAIGNEVAPQDGSIDGAVTEESSSATEFLKKLCGNGKIAKATIVKEAQSKGIPWVDIESAYIDLGLAFSKKGPIVYWQFKEYAS